MSGNGQPANGDAQVLRWTARVLSADDLRRHLNGHRELVVAPRAVITPLAADHLRSNGVRIVRQEERPAAQTSTRGGWGYAQEKADPTVGAVVKSLEREGLTLQALPATGETPGRWAQAVAACIARGDCAGGIVFCSDPGLVCCVANKVAGLRAVSVLSVTQAARATLSLGANLVAVEVPGRTLFEVRQILRTVCGNGAAACPTGLADTLRELDGHAHR